ncbi:hypothetical protein DFH07DRAFT_786471 [Mycena maculata]|uniref:Uncharacterized protein n=1 Tax=Mycena maculata TaxID=230809 RepID=A0AAD7KG93_9AGAR|nr:hypothetical protein DFH07DRAFT_786471 [Mycena maculata]
MAEDFRSDASRPLATLTTTVAALTAKVNALNATVKALTVTVNAQRAENDELKTLMRAFLTSATSSRPRALGPTELVDCPECGDLWEPLPVHLVTHHNRYVFVEGDPRHSRRIYRSAEDHRFRCSCGIRFLRQRDAQSHIDTLALGGIPGHPSLSGERPDWALPTQ